MSGVPLESDHDLQVCLGRGGHGWPLVALLAHLSGQSTGSNVTPICSSEVLAAAVRHRVVPLLCESVNRSAEATAEDIVAELRDLYRANALTLLSVGVEVRRVLDLLAGAGIACLLLKGISLAGRYYRDMARRHVGDIDVLVRAEQLRDAIQLLTAAGYSGGEEMLALSPKQWRFSLFSGQHVGLTTPDGVVLELHWRPMVNPFMFQYVWDDCLVARVDVMGAQVPCLRDEECLLYLCAHGARHAWFRLKWLCDLPAVLVSRQWHWPTIFEMATRFACDDAVRLGLLLAHRLLVWPIPKEVSEWIATGRDLGWACEEAIREMAEPEEWSQRTNAPLRVWLRQLWFRWRFYDSWKTRAREVARYSTSSEDWKLLPLPDWLFWLYFPLRPFLVLWRRAAGIVRARADA